MRYSWNDNLHPKPFVLAVLYEKKKKIMTTYIMVTTALRDDEFRDDGQAY